jgi:GntR family transcriptional regulator
VTDTLAKGVHTVAPLYKEVKRLVTRALADGEWKPGEALPSETRLAERYRVSIGTLRKAVDELVAEQVLVRQQGRGTFVATHDASRLLYQFFRVVRTDGQKELPEPELLAFERGRAEADEARRLGIAEGDRVLRIRNLLTIRGAPVVLDHITLAHASFPALTEKIFRERQATIYSLYQTQFGINVVRAVERVRARLADRNAARVLGVEPGTALLEINRLAMTYHSAPVELRRSLVNTAHHEYVSDVDKL